jgi:hypothetical protein
MKEIDGMAAYTKVVYVDERGEMIPKLSFLERDFMTSDAAKYPRMRLVLQKSNALIFRFLQRLKLSKIKSNRVSQIKDIEDLDESDQQEFLWFKKVWVSKTFQGKFTDAHGTDVSGVNVLDLSMDLCDECCVTIDVSIVTKLDRSKGELIPHFPSSKASPLSPKKSLVFSRLGLGLSGHPKLHEFQAPESPVLSSKIHVQAQDVNKKDTFELADLAVPDKLLPTLASTATATVSSPVRDRMSSLTVHPSFLLRKLGSPIQKHSPKDRNGSPSPGSSLQNHQERRPEREQLWSREPVLMPSLIDSMRKSLVMKGEASTLIGLIAKLLDQKCFFLTNHSRRQNNPDPNYHSSNTQSKKAGFLRDGTSLPFQVSTKSWRHRKSLVGR